MKKLKWLWLLFSILISFILPLISCTDNSADVLRVVDGDTIEVSIDGTTAYVRYIGVNAPEMVYPLNPEPCGLEASVKNKELVEGKRVRLEKDVSETDNYGRLLRYVYVGEVFINAELVKQGYAKVSTIPPDVKYQDLFSEAEGEAKEAKRGCLSTTITTTTIPTTTIFSLNIVSVTSLVSPGASATLVAQTSPNADCDIDVYYASGRSTASGLYAKKANSSGMVSWTWKVGTRTTAGTWDIVVTASYGGKTVTQSTSFTVR